MPVSVLPGISEHLSQKLQCEHLKGNSAVSPRAPLYKHVAASDQEHISINPAEMYFCFDRSGAV